MSARQNRLTSGFSLTLCSSHFGDQNELQPFNRPFRQLLRPPAPHPHRLNLEPRCASPAVDTARSVFSRGALEIKRSRPATAFESHHFRFRRIANQRHPRPCMAGMQFNSAGVATNFDIFVDRVRSWRGRRSMKAPSSSACSHLEALTITLSQPMTNTFFKSATLQSLPPESPGKTPRFVILATNVQTGALAV